MRSSKRDPRVYLEDILSAIARLEKYAVDGRDAFFTNFLVQDAIIRQVSILGEASGKLPKKLIEHYPEIPWKDIISMRNIIIHDYSEIDLPTVWDSVEQDLPQLKKAITVMLKEIPD
ncbi:MAG: DUF86 domain-containing protein [Candidatus Peregrinibacteria bacterium]|nr:DUF86 domain-containing protein [Candidatus Peregrinibacteria bacterium]